MRNPIAKVLQRSPIISYFVLAFGLSWLAWLPYLLSQNGMGLLDYRFPTVLGSTQLTGILPGAYLGPIAAGAIMTAVGEGRPGMRRWLSRFVAVRVRFGWYPLTLLGVPLVIVGATFVLPGAATAFRTPDLALVALYLPMLVVQFFTTGLAEEPGWRDYALPHLQNRFGPLAGTLILGPLWAAWHLPLFLTEWSLGRVDYRNIAAFVVLSVALSIVLTWVFNHARESLLIIMLFHANINAFGSTLWPGLFPGLPVIEARYVVGAIGFGAVALVLLMLTRGRLGYETRSTLSQHFGSLTEISDRPNP
ncbi:CAAX amino protease [Planotetraspora thailandica]|uniref:CAAX amino protease n=1 Tax=Planotetraspora thailandica TaxID=487172 RepID=A0A8J3V4X5_9ACTN|nr:CAAX amino protease [Planotetraspora thailandica]